MVVGLRLGHGHSNREGDNGVTREVALGPAAVMAMGLGLVIKPQQLPCWHAEPLLHLNSKHDVQPYSVTSVLGIVAACTQHMDKFSVRHLMLGKRCCPSTIRSKCVKAPVL